MRGWRRVDVSSNLAALLEQLDVARKAEALLGLTPGLEGPRSPLQREVGGEGGLRADAAEAFDGDRAEEADSGRG